MQIPVNRLRIKFKQYYLEKSKIEMRKKTFQNVLTCQFEKITHM